MSALIAMEHDPEAVDTQRKRDVGVEDLVAYYFALVVKRLEDEAKPFFDVDTKSFLRRVVFAIVPSRRRDRDVLSKPDFYGPLLLAFAVASVQRFNAGYSLGGALVMSFTSLVLGSLLLSLALRYNAVRELQEGPAAAAPTSIAGMDKAVSIVGYSFSGPLLLVLCQGHVPSTLLLVLFLLIEGAAALSLGGVAFRAMGSARPLLCAAIAAAHAAWVAALLWAAIL